MVLFVCGSCHVSMKKSRVLIHLNHECKLAQSVKCVDCSKEFGRDDYESHMCISEIEKCEPSSCVDNKSKRQLQQEEINRVFESVSSKILKKDPSLKLVVERLLSNLCIPRKEKQFRNVLLRYGITDEQFSLLFSIFSKALRKFLVQRSRNTAKEQKNKTNAERESDVEVDEKSKRSKKRSLEDEGEESESTSAKKKKKSKKNREAIVHGLENRHSDSLKGNADGCNSRLNASLIDEIPVPFKWKTSIRQLLESGPEEGMKFKKLQKEVLSHYFAAGGENGHVLPKDELKSIFKKKILNDKFLVENELISLRNID